MAVGRLLHFIESFVQVMADWLARELARDSDTFYIEDMYISLSISLILKGLGIGDHTRTSIIYASTLVTTVMAWLWRGEFRRQRQTPRRGDGPPLNLPPPLHMPPQPRPRGFTLPSVVVIPQLVPINQRYKTVR